VREASQRSAGFPERLGFPEPGEGILVLLKLMGETCNINCLYCYEKRKPYPEALALSPDVLSRFLAMCGRRPLRVVLHGGEPLLIGRRRLGHLLSLLRQHPGGVSLAMQTNGLLVSDRWLDFFESQWPDIEVGVSLDGDEAGSAHRVDYRNRPTYAGVANALELFGRRGWSIGVISVVTGLLLGRARDVVEHTLRFPAVRALKLSPCLDYNVVSKTYRTPSGGAIKLLNPSGSGRPGWATTPREYADFVTQAWDAWIELGAYRRFLLEPAISVTRNLLGHVSHYHAFGDAKEPYMVTLYPDGRIGSSDELRMPDALLGRVGEADTLDGMLAMATNPGLRSSLERLVARCQTCAYREACRGGSLADRMRYQDTDFDDQYCDYRKRIIDHVRATMDAAGAQPLTAAPAPAYDPPA
jgi:radical SAM protein with 4Fe4S-binding SPASM domain